MFKKMNRISENLRRKLEAKEKIFKNKIIEILKCNN